MNKTKWNLGISGLALLAVVWLGTTGCQSLKHSTAGNLASTTVTNQPMADVRSAVAGVFATHGYSGGETAPNQFTFTRIGSPINETAYGNGMSTENVVVTISQQTSNLITLNCNAWLVERRNDPMFQNSPPTRPLPPWPYEQLLKEIKTQLGE